MNWDRWLTNYYGTKIVLGQLITCHSSNASHQLTKDGTHPMMFCERWIFHPGKHADYSWNEQEDGIDITWN